MHCLGTVGSGRNETGKSRLGGGDRGKFVLGEIGAMTCSSKYQSRLRRALGEALPGQESLGNPLHLSLANRSLQDGNVAIVLLDPGPSRARPWAQVGRLESGGKE